MNKVLIVIMFILLGTSLIVVSNMNKGVENSFIIEYQNNKNLALPDLTEDMEISTGLYRYRTQDGITMDYNIYNGNITLNGTRTTGNNNLFLDLYKNVFPNGTIVSFKYYYQSGTFENTTEYIHLFPNSNADTGAIRLKIGTNYTQTIVFENYQFYYEYLVPPPRIYLGNGTITFDNFTFRVQLEKGSQATNYVVPKLIPIYKDNLTQQEKNNIGLGAFGGITKIIKTISDIIKPVGDFVNGLLSIF